MLFRAVAFGQSRALQGFACRHGSGLWPGLKVRRIKLYSAAEYIIFSLSPGDSLSPDEVTAMSAGQSPGEATASAKGRIPLDNP